ncbi:hypothetical protein AU468_11600 [Alkalispirochaeta sphaeroplastigenens]|uniref:Uncharacterized protein n=1 Tax=Alkalispirochaeta sphaeroplastigenens TaxID=1187066 RepID=A0A2S4JHK0_9SPIO|nr:hypothetical protein [Alkalispirochaeta sphaeroplastigenens]POQ99024.1 hypothetical protein AU468_11600 [Alkalispirochaeta sphaeroplastigenens]
MTVTRRYGLVVGLLSGGTLIGAALMVPGRAVLAAPEVVFSGGGLPVGVFLLSLIVLFFEIFPVVVAAAGLFCFSLVVSPREIGPAGSGLLPGIPVILVVVVALGVVNGIWVGALAPLAESRLRQEEHRAITARNAMAEAEFLLGQGDDQGAEELLLLHRTLAGESEASSELLRRARSLRLAREEQRRVVGEPSLGEVRRFASASSLTAADLLARGRDYFEAGDFFSAHYFATRALEQSSFPREDARVLRAEALNAIERGALDRRGAEDRRFYQDKVTAYQAFLQGQAVPERALEAYYRFQDLQDRRPDDPDVRRFAPEVFRQVQEISFFVETARAYQTVPGRGDLVFLNRQDETVLEIIQVDHLVRIREGDFFYGLEVLRLDPARPEEPILHLRAPYGIALGDQLILRAVRRQGDYQDQAEARVPLFFYRGSPDDFEGALRLHHSVESIARFGGGPGAFHLLTLPELFGLPRILERLGQPQRFARAAALFRVLRMGGFFVLALAGISLGWCFRSRYLGRPPLAVLAMVPVLIWALWWAVALGRYLVGSVADLLAREVSFSTGLLLVAVGLAGAVLAVMTSLARQEVDL